MKKLLILPILFFTLVTVTPVSADEYQDADESAKTLWSESVFVQPPLWCEKPTEQCFKKVDRFAQGYLDELNRFMNFPPALRNFRNCISKVEDTKRHRALLEFAKDNPYKWHLEISQFWIQALEKKFPHCD